MLAVLGAVLWLAVAAHANDDDDELCMRPPSKLRVSVIVPTTAVRASFHQSAYACFAFQTYEDRELVVLEESAQPSVFWEATASKDKRVRYIWRAAPLQISLGKRRNELVKHSTGQVIAHFDDDDFYGPAYLETMVGEMEGGGVGLVKLSGYFSYLVKSKLFGFWDQNVDSGIIPIAHRDPAFPLDTVTLHYSRFTGIHAKPNIFPPQPWDFGFTLVYTRKLFDGLGGFADMNMGEDAEFAARAVQAGRCKAIVDMQGIALKIMHSKTTSNAILQYVIPRWFAVRLLGPQSEAFVERADLIESSAR